MMTIDFGVARGVYEVIEYPEFMKDDYIRDVLEIALNGEDVPTCIDSVGIRYMRVYTHYLVIIFDDQQVKILYMFESSDSD